MNNLIHNIKIYFSFLNASLKGILIYRLDCIMAVFSQLVTQIVSFIFMIIVFQNTDNLAGWNFQQILLLYGITRISIGLSGFCFDSLYDIGPKYIKDGEFDKIILRPIHPLISIIGSSREFVAIGDLILGIVITLLMLSKLLIPITFILIFKIIFFSIIGALIIGAINTIVSISSFWTYRSNEVIWTFYRVYKLAEYPINIYSKFIQFLISFIMPFAFVAYYPTTNYLSINSYMIYASPVIAIVFWIIAIKVWNRALNLYRSTGT